MQSSALTKTDHHTTADCPKEAFSVLNQHQARHFPEIQTMIQSAQLSERAAQWSLAVFQQLAEAEGAVHGIQPEQVHFHEVGAIDAIIDIVGTCIGLDWLDIDYCYCSPLPTGGGTVWAEHGRLPIPAPAVLRLFQMGQVPIYSNGINKELVTPTGAAIATTLAHEFGPPPAMVLQTIGLGAGQQNMAIPNILRLWIGHSDSLKLPKANHHIDSKKNASATHSSKAAAHTVRHTVLPSPSKQDPETQTITILETQLDDSNPQIIGYVFDRLLEGGALDVFTQAIGMKKSRPGILLTALCLPSHASACEAIIFRETTTLGIRRRHQKRSILHRKICTVHTKYGEIGVKVASLREGTADINVKPEYEDCARHARFHGVSLHTVHDEAIRTWQRMKENN